MGIRMTALLLPKSDGRGVQDGPLSPPLKWAGGKRWLLPELEPLWANPQHRRLVEPFCGGLAVALGLNPQNALLNDANPHLINFYRQLQTGLNNPEPFQNDSDFYYQAREAFNYLIATGESDSPEAARLFYYLNRTGYNGLCRFNRKGLFNVPFGQYKTIAYASDFLEYRPAFSNWTFSLGDFEVLTIQPGDWVYADPPYDVPFVSYSSGGFTWQDQERLADWLGSLPVPAVASNQATDRILNLYKRHGFEIRLMDAPRRISCTGDRTPAREMLALKGF